jgi:nucleotide-binding universal stress UspA family protein
VDGFRWSHEEIGRKAIEEGIRLASYYNWDSNLRKARERIAPALKALSVKGIEVAVELYAGSMRRAIQEYAAKGDVHLIVSRAGIGQKIAGLLTGNSSLFDLFKRPSFNQVLLIHPTTVA